MVVRWRYGKSAVLDFAESGRQIGAALFALLLQIISRSRCSLSLKGM